MSKVETDIVERLGCSQLEARELERTTATVADRFAALYSAFALDHVIATKRALKKVAMSRKPSEGNGWRRSRQDEDRERAQRIKQNRRAMPATAKTMWKAHLAADDAWEQYRLAYQGVPSADLGMDALMTFILEQRHARGQLRQAVKVIEGRVVFEALGRQTFLREELGVKPTYLGYDGYYQPPRW